MRIAIDGYNLAMPFGTGVSTYGATLASVFRQMGHQVEGVFGLRTGRREATRELLFFEHFGHGHRLSPKQVYLQAGASMAVDHRSRRLIPVPITSAVEKRGLGSRFPSFDAVWSSPLLFETAYARFLCLRRFLTVRIPDPPDIMHWTYPLPIRMEGARNVYTLHDLVPLKLPHTTLDDKRYYYDLVAKCIRTADHICTVSEASRKDILELFDMAPERITNTYQSSPVPAELSASDLATDAAIVQGMFGLAEKGYYLFFGAVDPKKNLDRVIDAYLTSNSKLPLVIVSARDWGMKEGASTLGNDGSVYGRDMSERIVRLEYLPRTTLFRLIRSAKAVLFPSLYEGFGLPALEAIQLGTPVISSSVSSMPEIVGDAGLLVDPYRPEEIAAAIRALDTDAELYRRLVARGPAQAAKFTDGTYAARLSQLHRAMGLAGTD